MYIYLKTILDGKMINNCSIAPFLSIIGKSSGAGEEHLFIKNYEKYEKKYDKNTLLHLSNALKRVKSHVMTGNRFEFGLEIWVTI